MLITRLAEIRSKSTWYVDKKTIKFGYIFDETEKEYSAGRKVIIHKGGTGSGKTYDIMLFLVLFVAMREKGRIITVVSESKPHLDIGAIRIAKKILMELGLNEKVKFNISKGVLTFPSKSIIEFFSADRIEKALGARRWLLYGNEINTLKFEVFDELARRSKYVIGDFNPTAEFWLEKFLTYYGDHIIIKSNYLVNNMLPGEERRRIELRAKLDANFRRTHVDVEYGNLEGLIFPEWKQVDEMPGEFEWKIRGMDFGFTNDPTAIVHVACNNNEIYLDEEEYRTGLLASDIIRNLFDMGLTSKDEIVADNKPEAIYEIHRAGINIRAAYKPAGSVIAGIEAMKRYRINITKRSVNLIREFRNYSWKQDSSGKSLNEPIDKFNHGIDAARYAVMAKSLQRTRILKVGSV
ncbi:MAG: phage large subunit terminase [Bacteroidetes bacterium]|nr:MAG: phage large subunit terminase [Bacteroidota bacterium]